MLDSLRHGLRGLSSRCPPDSPSLPVYSPLTTNSFESSTGVSPSSSTGTLPLPESPTALEPAQRHAIGTTTKTAAASSPSWLPRPSLSRFLADFTLGFADGLTVPFALTAGLSSLGQTDTVIYAGMAEICAGSISMGIGGYLSARGEAGSSTAAVAADADPGCVEDEEGCVDEKGAAVAADRYLAPLDLPPELLDLVREHVEGREDVVAALERKLAPEGGEEDEDMAPAPVLSGMSVALGYLIGGSLPLFPYFVVRQVGDGLLWSFIVCIIALFTFGFSKDFVLHMRKGREEVWVSDKGTGSRAWSWKDVRRSSWEGTQMVMLGSMAAFAAVFCVRLFDGMGYAGPEP